MAQVVLIRPGSTVYDEQDRIQGALDIPLSERGWTEAQRLAQALQTAGIKLSALYCGPGENACQTAEVIGKTLDLRSKPMDQFRNLDHGLWQGLCVEEVRRRNPKVYRQWIDAPLTVCPPMGETVEQTQERLRAALKPLIRRHRDEAFGLVIAEPCAQLVAAFLRQDPEVHLEEHAVTGRFEQIDVAPELCRNGKG